MAISVFHSSHNCLVRIEGRLSFDGAFERAGGEIQWLFWVNTVRAPLPPCSGSLTSSSGGGVWARSHEAPQVWTTPRGLLRPSQAEPLEWGLHPQTPAGPRGPQGAEPSSARWLGMSRNVHSLTARFRSTSCVPGTVSCSGDPAPNKTGRNTYNKLNT